MKIINKIISVLMVIFLFLIVLLSNLQYLAFDKNFYIHEFNKYGIEDVTGMDSSQLNKVAARIQDYLFGKVDSLQLNAVIDGQNQKVFNEKN
jgi:Protein of unknown function (DUF1461).